MITLQNFIFPDPVICTEHNLYYRIFGVAGFSQSKGEVSLGLNGLLVLDTYFNLFSIGKWHQSCQLDGLYAEVFGSGLVEIRVFHALPGRSWEILHCEVTTLAPDNPYRADLSSYTNSSLERLFA